MKIIQIKTPKMSRTVEIHEERKEGEVKVKLSKIALSRTDLNLYMGVEEDIYPIIPSHSAIGYVSEADEGSGFKLGARVAIDPFVDVSSFSVGKERAKAIEVMGITRNGLLADFANVPVECVYALPEGIKDEEAIFLDYISFGSKVFENYDFNKGDYVAIIGSGIFQLILGQLAIYYQIVPILIDQNADKLDDAKNFGIYYTIDASSEDVSERVKEITGGRMAEFSVFLPKETLFNVAVDITMQGGTVIIAGFDKVSDKLSADVSSILKKQLTIIGVNNGANETASAINLLANKIIKTEGLISKEVDFASASNLFKDWARDPSKYRKVIVLV
ncbi:MAG: zinc-binding dehydrogenase [Clostridia bacterium]|nr:zinc-binding dehydrogenase [Clostridia bacterium]